MNVLIGILFVVVSILLIGVVLLQKGRGGGLSGAFGGAGGHSAFGTRTGDMFTWVTVVLVALFLLLGVASVHAFRPESEKLREQQQRADQDVTFSVDETPAPEAPEPVVEPTTAPVTTVPAEIEPETTQPSVVAPTTDSAPADGQ